MMVGHMVYRVVWSILQRDLVVGWGNLEITVSTLVYMVVWCML